MRSSRYIRCGSGVRLRRSQTRPPLLSRSTTTYCPPTSDRYSSSQPNNYLPQPISQPHGLEKSAHTPSHYNSTQDYLSKPSDPEFFEELHRKIWGDRSRVLPKDPAFESQQDLDSPSNETSKKRVGFQELWPSRYFEGRSDEAWRKGMTELRAGRLIHYSVSAQTAPLLDCESADEARRIWAEQDAETIKYGWVSPLVTLLSQNVRQACLFLQALCPLSDPPAAVMSDSIRHICTVLEEEPESCRRSATDFLCDAVIHILREHPDRDQLFKQWDIYKLQRLVSPKRLVDLYNEMSHAGVFMRQYTLMQIASTLAVEPTLKRAALDVMIAGLNRLRDEPEGKRVDGMLHARWESVFTTILHTRRQQGPKHTLAPKSRDVIGPDEIWEVALEYSLDPGPIHINTLVDSLFAVGRGDDAWNVFDMYVEERGRPVSLKLASTLLYGSRMTGSLPYMQRALGIVAETGELDEVLGNDILHLVFKFALADTTKVFSSFRVMQRLYSRMFRTEALDALLPEKLHGVVDPDSSLADMLVFPGFVDHLDKLFVAQKGKLMDPPGPVLQVMVMSWICSIKKGFKGPALIAFYGHYRGMLKQGHPVAAGIVKENNSIIHDMIIKGMGGSATHLQSALEVIGDMLRDQEEPAQPSGGARGRMWLEPRPARPVHPRPTEWTWNILLDCWLQHFKQESVGRIVGLMKKHGVEPSLVTWNTILSRAGEKGNMQLAVKAAREIRDRKYIPNEWTMNAFAQLPDKEMFLHEMQRDERGGPGRGREGAPAWPNRKGSG